RGRNNDLVLDDPSVSRLHAEIRRDVAGQLTLHDLESLNGVFVNDNRTEQFQLREGDTVDIGDVRLYYTEKDTPTGAQSPS
ncbi:MAG: FHA domain-containing protein, partial [Gammaproteobacteria bacterium]